MQLEKMLYKVLREYDVLVTKRTIERDIFTHPDFPSMRCISDALDGLKVKNIVLKLSFEKLLALDVPVIATLKKGELIWVTQFTESKVHYWSGSGKEKNMNHSCFEKEWTGEVLAIEDVTDAGESNYREKRKKEIKENVFRYVFTFGSLVLLILLILFSWINDSSLSFAPKLLFLIVNSAGCYISYTLIRQEKQQSSRLAKNFVKQERILTVIK